MNLIPIQKVNGFQLYRLLKYISTPLKTATGLRAPRSGSASRYSYVSSYNYLLTNIIHNFIIQIELVRKLTVTFTKRILFSTQTFY